MAESIKGKRIFITGGAGFIGSTLAGLLLDDNEVTIFDNFTRNAIAGKPFEKHPNLRTVKGDVLEGDGFRSAAVAAKPDIFVHAAAIAGIATVVKSPTMTMRVNMIGTANALGIARQLDGLERFVDFSTSEVFGSLAFRSRETTPATLGEAGEARWTYAVSKLAGEHLSAAYFREFSLPTVMVRPFNVYGPGQVGDSALRTFILRALAGEDIHIYGDGNQIRAWCYVSDFVEGLLLCMTHPDAVGESFNIGNSRAVITILGLAETCLRVLESKSKIIFAPPLSADIELRIPSVQKAREVLGFESKVDLEQGVRLTAETFLKDGVVKRA